MAKIKQITTEEIRAALDQISFAVESAEELTGRINKAAQTEEVGDLLNFMRQSAAVARDMSAFTMALGTLLELQTIRNARKAVQAEIDAARKELGQ